MAALRIIFLHLTVSNRFPACRKQFFEQNRNIDKKHALSITDSMKVAVSIPDPVFAEAEALAKRMKLSRSKLCAKALDAFVADNATEWTPEDINAVLHKIGNEPDPFVMEAARQTLKRVEWMWRWGGVPDETKPYLEKNDLL